MHSETKHAASLWRSLSLGSSHNRKSPFVFRFGCAIIIGIYGIRRKPLSRRNSTGNLKSLRKWKWKIMVWTPTICSFGGDRQLFRISNKMYCYTAYYRSIWSVLFIVVYRSWSVQKKSMIQNIDLSNALTVISFLWLNKCFRRRWWMYNKVPMAAGRRLFWKE